MLIRPLPAVQRSRQLSQLAPRVHANLCHLTLYIEMVEIGRSVVQKAPDEATEARWLTQCEDVRAREFGGAEAAARAADLARAYVARTSRNGFKGGFRVTLRGLARELNAALREQREMLRRR